ncbi:sensor histidine kinase [Companilactobacillus jidongensis]|uniref:sensor histidine kinase n=1 Tax=Companilactobacillus jidongensis TaxID=2486006 RepID=UPI000F78DEDF|nr:HAMP domain-containing sensor histidine kinase [Companilactobacillus jidongensis]
MNKRIKLDMREKGVLLFEGIGTFLLFQIINITLVIISDLFYNNETFESVSHVIKNINGDLSRSTFWGIWFFFSLIILIELGISIHVVVKTYRQFEVYKVESELIQIAAGDLNHKINLKVNKRLQSIVDSVNLLVSNTNKHISEQKKSEDSKDELIANVSHDLRTPLTSVIGYLGLIEGQNFEDIGQILKYSHIAYNKSLEMQNLVNSLFEYANVEQATSKLSSSTFDMTQMLDQLSADFELEANKRGMEIIVKSKPEKIMMNGDTEKLGRVFNNLITNAFKYGKGATHLWLEAEKTPEDVVVRVANNGQSIPQESLSHLFDRFYRVEDSRNKETGGTGLGLAIAQSMVKLHGGTISVTSDSARTAFIIHFPISGQ